MKGLEDMTNSNWCHGPNCHTIHTLSRIRGSKGNKVLRTIKIKENRYGNYQANIWNYFCNQGCLMNFMDKHAQAVTAIAPRREPLETPIKDPVKNEAYYGWTIEKKVG